LITYAALPLGAGVIADTFAGSGSTIAAAEAVGVRGVGVERRADYYSMALKAIPKLTALAVSLPSEKERNEVDSTLITRRDIGEKAKQLPLFPAEFVE